MQRIQGALWLCMPVPNSLTHLPPQRPKDQGLALPASFAASAGHVTSPDQRDTVPSGKQVLLVSTAAPEERCLHLRLLRTYPHPALPALDPQVQAHCLKRQRPSCLPDGACRKVQSHCRRRERRMEPAGCWRPCRVNQPQHCPPLGSYLKILLCQVLPEAEAESSMGAKRYLERPSQAARW